VTVAPRRYFATASAVLELTMVCGGCVYSI
jgi:hypothetical protein